MQMYLGFLCVMLCFLPTFSEYAEKLFDMVDNFAESSKRKAAVWPLQIMLLILCPVRKYPLYSACLQCLTLSNNNNEGEDCYDDDDDYGDGGGNDDGGGDDEDSDGGDVVVVVGVGGDDDDDDADDADGGSGDDNDFSVDESSTV